MNGENPTRGARGAQLVRQPPRRRWHGRGELPAARTPPRCFSSSMICWVLGVIAPVFFGALAGRATEAEALVADRTAIEHVYYAHRLGNKPPFDDISPPALIQRLVERDRGKEQVLKRVYGVEITEAEMAAEIQRIGRTTQAPEMLAGIRAALGNDPRRFARAYIKPILVDRELRARFENDDGLHASNRTACAAVRRRLLGAAANGASPAQLLAKLKAVGSNHVTEITWQLGAAPDHPAAASKDELEVQRRFGAGAQLLSAPETPGPDTRPRFSELPDDLQRVLRLQLRQAGDISAVIETSGGFSLYLAERKSSGALSAAVLFLPKRDYDQWVETESEPAL